MSTTASSTTAPVFRLLADIGGTNARFALEDMQGAWQHIQVLPCAQFHNLTDAVQAYFERIQVPMVRDATVAIANPVQGDWIEMTNHHWRFSIEATRTALGLDNLFVTNDFTALAMALPYLPEQGREQIGGTPHPERAVLGLLGAGTGLGVSGLIPADDRWIALGSEGGHVSFAPGNELERQVLEVMARDFPHVSAERLLSGPGLQLIYRAICTIQGENDAPTLSTPEIVERGNFKTHPICEQVLHVFSGMLGSMAGNVALMLGSLGGIYLGGGVVPKMGPGFDRDYFRQRFEKKGRFANYLRPIPCYLITAEFPAFLGVSAILRDALKQRESGGSLLQKIGQLRNQLAPAERLVADFALTHSRSMTQLPVTHIAQRAGVSEPTVIRFCRSLGFQGLSDFKLQLAGGLSGTMPMSFSQVHWGDATPDLSAKVLDNTIAALMQTREDVNNKTMEQAISLLASAKRMEVFGCGQWACIAEDAHHKLMRFGIPTAFRGQAHVQSLIAKSLNETAVVLVLSRNGQEAELLACLKIAASAGAHIVAICPYGSPIAELAEVVLSTPAYLEQDDADVPMISRTIQLSLVDVLSVGMANFIAQNRGQNTAVSLPSNERAAAPLLQSTHFG